MVPTAIVKQAKAMGVDMISICDHNSAENVAAVVEAGRRESLSVIPGIEVTSQEEVHILGLFPAQGQALGAQAVVYENLPAENDEETFGRQTVVDEWDRPAGVNKRLLIGASGLTLEEVVRLIHEFGGLAIASHVDREGFGLIGHLGFVPEGLELDGLELSPRAPLRRWGDFPVVRSSDAHRLSDIGKGWTSFLAAEPGFAEIARALRNEGGRRVLTSMEDLSLHILDLVENSLAASATRIEIRITEDTQEDLLRLEITDNGKGMDAQTQDKVLDPFFTTRTTRRVGLGLPLLAQAAEQAGGRLEVTSQPERGTTVRAEFHLSHPDLKPMGNIAETVRAILAGRPELGLVFEYRKDSELVAATSTEPRQRSE
jgi:hypothetical protein